MQHQHVPDALDFHFAARVLPTVFVRSPPIDCRIQSLDLFDWIALLPHCLLRARRRDLQVDRGILLARKSCFLFPKERGEALQRSDAVLSRTLVSAEFLENFLERYRSDVPAGVELPPSCQVVLDVPSIALGAFFAAEKLQEPAN